MSLVIPDFLLISRIAAYATATVQNPIVKTTHRWPSGITKEGYLCAPKMSVGVEHKVYERAPHGRYGNPFEPPLLIVYVDDLYDSRPYEWTDEEMLEEGFYSLDDYAQWWEAKRAYKHLHCKSWSEMQNEPFWVCRFHLVAKTQYYTLRCESYLEEIQKG